MEKRFISELFRYNQMLIMLHEKYLAEQDL